MNQHFMEIFGSVLVALITALFGPIAILWIKRKLTKSKDEIEIEIFSTEKMNSGLYVYKLTGKSGFAVGKFIVQKN